MVQVAGRRVAPQRPAQTPPASSNVPDAPSEGRYLVTRLPLALLILAVFGFVAWNGWQQRVWRAGVFLSLFVPVFAVAVARWWSHAVAAAVTAEGVQVRKRLGTITYPRVQLPLVRLVRGETKHRLDVEGRLRDEYHAVVVGPLVLAKSADAAKARRLAEGVAAALGVALRGSSALTAAGPHDVDLLQRLRRGPLRPGPLSGPPRALRVVRTPSGFAARSVAVPRPGGVAPGTTAYRLGLGASLLLAVLLVLFVSTSEAILSAGFLAFLVALLVGLLGLAAWGLVQRLRCSRLSVEGTTILSGRGRGRRRWQAHDPSRFEDLVAGSLLSRTGLRLVADDGVADLGFAELHAEEQAWLRDAILHTLQRNGRLEAAPSRALAQARQR